MRASPRRHRSAVGARVTSSPRKRTRPLVGACAPTRRLSKVVFPAPLGPTTPTASPALEPKSRRRRAPRGRRSFSSGLPPQAEGHRSARRTSRAPRRRQLLYGLSFAEMGTLGRWRSRSPGSRAGTSTPAGAFTHCVPMIGPGETLGTGPEVKSTWPLMVTVLSVASALATAGLAGRDRRSPSRRRNRRRTARATRRAAASTSCPRLSRSRRRAPRR